MYNIKTVRIVGDSNKELLKKAWQWLKRKNKQNYPVYFQDNKLVNKKKKDFQDNDHTTNISILVPSTTITIYLFTNLKPTKCLKRIHA